MKFSALLFACLAVYLFSCQNTPQKPTIEFDQALADKLMLHKELDQTAAWIPKGKFKELSSEEWRAYKDSVFTTNKAFLEEVFEQHGFPGFDLVGKDGSNAFWLMTQHSDFDPEFQKKVLDSMEKQVMAKNAKPSNFALLTDRYLLNSGELQLYGTQMDYDMSTGKAMPKSLQDPANVDKRRAAVGLPPLNDYLNQMSKSHWEMNKESYLAKGVTEPYQYR